LKSKDSKMRQSLLIFVFLLSLVQGISAHEVRPAYLELHQTTADTYDVLWKVPGLGKDMRLGLYVELPDNCTILGNPRTSMMNQAFTERWTIKCEGGLSGKLIRIDGLSATTTDVLVRLELMDGSTQVTRLTPASPSFVVATPAGAMGVARTYTVLGIEHILSGIDHLLFVLALIIITGGGWKLVKTVTAFTVSHTITLTLATLGFIHIPTKPVEAIIALSIVFVAAEILRSRAGKPSFTQRAPWVVAFAFGLMHGLGFASGLSNAGLPDAHIPTALLFFSIGVETGHFLFIGFVLLLTAILNRAIAKLKPIFKQRMSIIQLVPPYIIGSVAMFWVIQRILSF
jgi:hydrogenase/urease accessory protein HupE